MKREQLKRLNLARKVILTVANNMLYATKYSERRDLARFLHNANNAIADIISAEEKNEITDRHTA